MRSLKTLLCMICASFMLVGCSYFDTAEGPDIEHGAPGEQIDLMNPEIQSEALAEPLDVTEVINRSTGGSVQIFSLDAPTPLASPGFETIDAAPAVPVGGLGTFDPDVQVFPLDGQMQELVPQQYMPPSEQKQIVLKEPMPLETSAEEVMQQASEPQEEYVSLDVPGRGVVRIYFEHDSATLDTGDMQALEGIIREFNPALGQGISVEGHASERATHGDAIQRKVINLKISMDRALAVSRSLMQMGVPAKAIRTIAWGDTKPPGATGDMDSESASRRVEVITGATQ